ncbi:hypothetical protein [Ornithinibacillus contaminans]|uniref:hypothetical protein n=1 Tax=Ornithinibacillus contaminans TaxID=694055 RepID=UPI0006A76FD8|nr:hypothetical protein [Ornithinibacillus contaminans]
MVDVTVSKENHDYNEREQKIFEVLMLNLASHANGQTVKIGMAMNPLKKSASDLFASQFAWQTSIENEVYEEFVEGVKRRYQVAFKMCDLEDVMIKFQENSYLVKE